MKILVTGGSGFIGKPLVRELTAKGHRVTVFAREDDIDRPDKAEMVLGDVAKKAELRKAFPARIVYHLAASMDDREPGLWDTNVKGTEKVIDLCKEYAVKQLVFMSTSRVFGETTKPAKERFPYSPKTEYDKSKVAAERLIRNSAVPYTIVRAPLIIGPNVTWFRVFEAIKGGYPLVGNGTNKFHIIHVEDVVRLLVNVMNNKSATDQVFHAGSKDLMTYREVYEAIYRHMKSRGKRKSVSPKMARLLSHMHWVKTALRTKQPPRIHMSGDYIDMMRRNYALSIKKAMDTLGFSPHYTTPAAIKETMDSLYEEISEFKLWSSQRTNE